MKDRSFTYKVTDKRIAQPKESHPTAARSVKIKAMLERRYKDVCVVLEDIFNPHNANAVLRTCDAFGVHNIHMIYKNVPFYDPYSIEQKGSTSAGKWVNVETHSDPDTLIDYLQKNKYTVFATVVPEQAEFEIMDADFSAKNIAFILGNEKRGISDALLKAASHTIAIPRLGMAQSLNISVAAGIFLYEMHRQRQAQGVHYQFTETEQQELFNRLTK